MFIDARCTATLSQQIIYMKLTPCFGYTIIKPIYFSFKVTTIGTKATEKSSMMQLHTKFPWPKTYIS
jgi:hypothetical protein